MAKKIPFDKVIKQQEGQTPKGLEDKNKNLKPDAMEGVLTPPKGMKFAKTCSVCGKGMSEGYVVGGGDEYFCSDECRNELYDDKKWKAMTADNNEYNYYTEWTPEDLFEPEDN